MNWTKHILVAIFSFTLISAVFIPSTRAVEEPNFVKFSVLNNEEGFKTIKIGEGWYSWGADFEVSDEKINYITSPWDLIAQEIENTNFMSTEVMEENPHTVIEIQYNGEYNKHEISHINIQPEPLPSLLMTIFNRVIGIAEFAPVWPMDIGVAVMESYPEQYGIDALIVRGDDMLDYVHVENATLVVTDESFVHNANFSGVRFLHTESKVVTLDHSRDYKAISFSSFSIGTDYRPNELHFTIIMDNGAYLYETWNDTLPMDVGHSNLNNFSIVSSSDLLTTLQNGIELPFPIIASMISLVAVIMIIKKKEN